MTTTCMAAMAAAVLAVQSQAGLDEEYFSHFSVSSYEVPERVLKSAESFYLDGEFTIQPEESGGITSLQPYLEEELVSNGIGFITLDVTTHGSTGGRLRMTFPALPSGVGSRTVVLETGTGTHTIVQTRPQALTYTLDPPGPKYPGDGQAITVTGGTVGAKYFLYHGGSLMAGTETVCDGGPMTFGPYSDTGEYRLYNEETGYTATAAEISDYDIFMPDGGISADDAMSMPLMLPSHGGAVTLELHSYEVIDREPYAAIAKRMNSEGVRGYWQPGDGISIAFDVKDAHTLELSFLCSPNFSSVPRTNDTGFHVDDPGRTLSVMQPGDPDGELAAYTLAGEWLDRDTGTFSLSLSGSQPGVEYTLTRDGGAVKALKGTGTGMSFGTFSGVGSFGEYRVSGEYGGKRMQSNSVAMRLADIPYGDNYVLRKTYLDAGGDSTVADVTYYDGLGYPEQTISQHGGGRGGNLVTPIVYDCMRRSDARAYLPYVSRTDDIYHAADAVERQSAWYRDSDAYPYRDRTYETGTSGRPLSVMREGAVYRERGVRAEMSYSVEDGTGGIMRLSYVYPSGESPAAVRNEGFWTGNSLQVTTYVSEDGDTSRVYADAFGRTIMTRSIDKEKNHDTYYVYDLKDSLVCVIQPGGVDGVGDGFCIGDTIADAFCFTWRYDAWGNVIESHVPGGGTVQTVYDQRNRPVLTSGSEMRRKGEWKYIIYDSLDRVTEEGVCGLPDGFEKVRLQMQSSTDITPHISDRRFLRSVEYYSSADLPAGFEQVLPGMEASGEGCLTLPRREILSVIGGQAGLLLERRFFYDRLGRLIETVEGAPDGESSVTAMQYDFTGNVTATFEGHRIDGKPYTMQTGYTYDDRGRRTSMRRTAMGGLAEVSYTYDDLGRPESTIVGDAGREALSHNLQGWRTGTADAFFGDSVFTQTIGYYTPVPMDANPSYGGRISGIRTGRAVAGTARDESYSYDGFGRLAGTSSLAGGRRDVNVEKDIRYDMDGNVTAMTRDADGGSHLLRFMFYGGRPDGMEDMTDLSERRYMYDADGRLRYEARVPRSGEGAVYEYDYNILGLMEKAMNDYTTFVEYSYLSDGTRTETKMSDGTSLKYRGSFVFRTGTDGRTELEGIAYDGGRLVAENRGGETVRLRDLWHVRDHLGSVRAVVDISEDGGPADAGSRILEESDHMSFGHGFSPYPGAPAMSGNRYSYSGREDQSFAGLPYIDYGARMYDPYAARWNATDPLAALFQYIIWFLLELCF